MTDVFVSYARADDEPFVRWLFGELRRGGTTVWFDRESMPSRSLTFMHEIRDAIDDADRMLVIVGQSALTSDYVRAEWQHAQVAQKVVIPVLRAGAHADLPAEFRNLHAVDFRAERDRDAALDELHRVLRDPVPPLGALYGDVPALAPHFLPRLDQFSVVADALLIDLAQPVTISGPDAFVVLQGMGGIGKSVLAAAFARSTAARRSFPDGLAWINVGESPDNELVARRLSRALPGTSTAGFNVSGDSGAVVRAQLAGKRVLVVLDDVARVEQLESVRNAADVNTRFLVTTRYADVFVASGSRHVGVDVLTAVSAKQMLADWLHTVPERLPPEADALARACGYHPLALALNGAMLVKGTSWTALLEALEMEELGFAETRLAHYPYRTVERSLQVSLDVLTSANPDGALRFRELAAFKWTDGVPEAAVARLWLHRGQLSARHTMKLLSDLEQRALVRSEGVAPNRTVRMHDLQLAHLRQPPADLNLFNRAVLSAYYEDCDGDWSRGPADGYFHKNLVLHLLAGDRNEDVHVLLRQEREGRNAWHQVQSDLGYVDQWFDDIDAALALTTDPHGLELAQRISPQVRYSLMKLSVQSQASAIPPPLLYLFADYGVITFAKALSFARAASMDLQQVDCFSRLLPLAPTELRRRLETEALAIAEFIQGPDRQLWALRRLIPSLSGTASQALAIMKNLPGDTGRLALLPELARVVPLEETQDIHTIAADLQDPLVLTETLAVLYQRDAKHTQILDEALTVAGRLRDASKRVRALCFVAAEVNSTRRFDLMEMALAATQRIDTSWELAQSLVAMAPFLSSTQLDRALDQSARLASDDERIQVIFTYLPHLPRAQRGHLAAREVARHRPRPGAIPWMVHNAAILASDLPPPSQAKIQPTDVGVIVRMATLPAGVFNTPRPMRARRWQYDAALEVLRCRLPDRCVPTAVDFAQSVRDPEDRAEILARLVPRLPESDALHLLSAEYEHVLAISDAAQTARALVACSAFVPEDQRGDIAAESLRLISQSAESTPPHSVIAETLMRLPQDQTRWFVVDQLDRIAGIADSRRRDNALATLAPSLTTGDVTRAVNLARSTVTDHNYTALASLVGLLDDDDREAAIDDVLQSASGWPASEIPSDFHQALADTVAWMNPKQIDDAFVIAQSVRPGAEYAGMLHLLAERLPREHLREGRLRAKQIMDPGARVSALAGLLRSATWPTRTRRTLTSQILRLAYSIDRAGPKASTLLVAARLPGVDRQQVLQDALDAVNRVTDDDHRATILCEMLPELGRDRSLAAFSAMLNACLGRRHAGSIGSNRYYAALGRPFLLSMLERAAPWLGTLEEPSLVADVTRSIRDVVRWWP